MYATRHFEFMPGASVPIDEVEPASEIVNASTLATCRTARSVPTPIRRWPSPWPAGGNSNTGEGGEDRSLQAVPNGDSIESASSRSPAPIRRDDEYLANAGILQMKMAQGAKPAKAASARLQGTTKSPRCGIPRRRSLISPPPHHDIYSIEDLAQLIST